MGDVFCCKQKTAYEMRISDWSSDVCSSDLCHRRARIQEFLSRNDADRRDRDAEDRIAPVEPDQEQRDRGSARHPLGVQLGAVARDAARLVRSGRSEKHTSELQSLMRISYADICLEHKTHQQYKTNTNKPQRE